MMDSAGRGESETATVACAPEADVGLRQNRVGDERREGEPKGYGYSRFCELYQRWSRYRDVVLRQDHRAGEKMFVDWVGPTIPIFDRKTGESMPGSLFVAALGASNYTYAQATSSQDLANWIDCHVRAFEYFQGVPKLVV